MDELDVSGEPGLGQPLHVIEHHVDVDRLALDRPLVGEHFHPVDQFHDAVGLVADEARERAIVIAGRLLEQLGGAANAGQWVLDLVREHRRQRADRTRRAAMRELAVHLVGDGPLQQHHHHVVAALRHRRHVQVDDAFAGVARRAEIDPIFVDRGGPAADLLDQRQQRAAERHQIA